MVFWLGFSLQPFKSVPEGAIWSLVPGHMFNEITNSWTWNSSAKYFSSLVPSGRKVAAPPRLAPWRGLQGWSDTLPQSAWGNDLSDGAESHMPL